MRAAFALTLIIWVLDIASKAMLPALVTTSRLPIVLLLLAILVLLCLPTERPPIARLARASMIGGALGNTMDMVVFGSIRDIFAIGLFVFNVADVAIAIGLLIWVVVYLRMVY